MLQMLILISQLSFQINSFEGWTEWLNTTEEEENDLKYSNVHEPQLREEAEVFATGNIASW